MKTLLHQFIRPLISAALCATAVGAIAADKVPVMASFSILGDLVQVVGGDRVAVTTLVGPDEDAHVFEPKPSDAKNMLQTKLMVTNGLGFEPWAQKLVKSAGYKGRMLVASEGIKPAPCRMKTASPKLTRTPGKTRQTSCATFATSRQP
jgi:zinc/manganese transport system substrate-binding protein